MVAELRAAMEVMQRLGLPTWQSGFHFRWCRVRGWQLFPCRLQAAVAAMQRLGLPSQQSRVQFV